MEQYFKVAGTDLFIWLPEEVDHFNSEKIRREADRILQSRNIRRIIFDFSRTQFMDSSGIAVVVTTMRRLKEYGGRLSIVNMPAQAYKVISATGLEKLIEIKCTNEVKR